MGNIEGQYHFIDGFDAGPLYVLDDGNQMVCFL